MTEAGPIAPVSRPRH